MSVPTAPQATPGNQRPVAPASWGGVFALALAAFALVASEFMPVSLLTPVAADLHITQGQAGQAITVSGAFALLTSLCISRLAGRVDRKHLLVALALLMIISSTVAAFAPNYAIFMIGRALIGVAIGGFWSMSAAAAMRLVPDAQVPRALAIVNGGNALATVVAAPLGSIVAAAVGWRWAFFCIVPVATLALCWKLVSLPAMKTASQARSANVLGLLRQPVVALGMTAVSLFFMGQFALFTYLRPFLESATGVNAGTLSGVLLLIGVAGFVGTVLIGWVLKAGIYRALVVIPLVMMLIAVVLPIAAPSLALTAMLLAVWGLFGTAAPVGWWTWLARTLPHDAEAGGGLMVAVVQLAIGLGAGMGGVLFDTSGYRATFGASALLLLVAAMFALLASRAGARSSTAAMADLGTEHA
ncbi:MAG TPA: MFS transporter [Stenotrophomonas sp.]|jgi:predicted MFS family arabinose efflux permease